MTDDSDYLLNERIFFFMKVLLLIKNREHTQGQVGHVHMISVALSMLICVQRDSHVSPVTE